MKYVLAFFLWMFLTWLSAEVMLPVYHSMLDFDHAMWAQTWTAIGLFVLCMLAAFRKGRPRRATVRKSKGSSKEAAIDETKWSYDSSTGEYYKVSFVSSEGERLISNETYNERASKRLRALSARQGFGRLTIVSLIALPLAVLCYHRIGLLNHSGYAQHPFAQFFFVVVAFFALCGVIAGCIGWLALAASVELETDVGPRPTAPQSPQDALDEDKDQARQPSIEEMRRAIGSRKGGGVDREPSFRA